MAEIHFSVSSDYNEVIRLRKECEKLEAQLKKMDVNKHPDVAKSLEKQLEKATRKIREYQEKYAKLKKVQDDIGKSNNTTDDVKKSTAALQSTNKWIEANTKAIIEADNQIKIFKKDFDSLSADDKAGSAGTAKLRQIEQVVAKRMAEAESIRKTIKVQKDKIIQDRAEEGSITQLRKQLSLLIVDYDNMGRLRREGGAGKALLAQIKVVQDELNKAEQASGRFQRNVGNYSSAFNGLGMSIQQIARELPTLSLGANMFFLAISNNLPIFFDEVQRARKEYTAYIAELKKGNTDVQKVAPVWKQIASGIFSWNTALTVGVTLLTVYGKDIVEWASKLLGAEKQLGATEKAQKTLNNTQLEGVKSAQKELTTLNLLYSTATNTSKSINERSKAVEELQKKYPDYLGNISKENILNGQAIDAYKNLAKSIQDVAMNRAILDEMTKNNTKLLELNAIYSDDELKKLSELDKQASDYLKWAYELDETDKTRQNYLKERLKILRKIESIEKGKSKTYDEYKKEKEIIEASNEVLSEKIKITKLDANYSSQTNQAKEAEQERERLIKIQESLSEALIKDELKYQSARLKLMEEGRQKRLAESELEYNEQKTALQKEYDDRLARYKELNQEMPEGVSQMFVQRGITIREQREQRDENIEKEYQDEILKRQQQLTDVFLSDEEKKIEAIKRRYDSEREWANQNLEGGQLSEYLALVNGAEIQEINNLNSDLYKNTEIWSQLFSDLEQYTTSTLQNILVKAKQVNTEGWDTSDIKAWQEAIDKVDKDINRRNPFQGIKKSWEGLMKSIKDGNKNDVGKFMTNLSNGLNEISSMAIQVGDTLTSAFSGGRADGLNEDVKNIINSVANAGQLTAGIATGNVAGIVSGGLGLATSIGKMFSGKSKAERDAERLAKVTDKIAQTNEVINNLIDKRVDLIKKVTAAERSELKESSLDIIERQRKMMETQFQKLLGNELLGKKGKNNDLDVKDLGISSIEDLANFLTSDKLVELMENGYGITDKDKWYGIVEEWEKLNDQADKLKETVSEINTGITFDEARDGLDDLLLSADTTFRDISDNFEGYMRKSVLNVVKSRYLNDEMQKWYDQFEQRTADEVLSDEDVNFLRQQYESMYKEAQNKVNGMLAAAGVGLEGASSSQESSKKGFATASQDQIEELNGRFTAGQIAWEETKNQAVMQTEKLSILNIKTESLVNLASDQRNIADETRTILANSYLELQQINENTGAIIKPITEIRDKMNSWDSKIRNM